jgi:hypothetical protein
MSGRDRIEPTPGGKRYVRRDDRGQLSQQANVASRCRLISVSTATKRPKRGEGDRGVRSA